MAKTPHTFRELFEFYYTFVKPLYGGVQLSGVLPVEVLFEINAAFDHVSRHWAYDEVEAEAVARAFSHLKRSCLDIFKLGVKEARRQYDELRAIDTSIIDNGDFDRALLALWNSIKTGGRDARAQEGQTLDDDAQHVHSFDLWLPVYEDCVTLETRFYNHPHVDWARKKQVKSVWWERVVSFVIGVVASLVATWVLGC